MNILSIGGSDPSSGAGIQADIRASSSLGANCLTTLTAVTSQNSKSFLDVQALSQDTVERQIDSVFSDFAIDAIVIGMVYSPEAILAIYKKIKGVKIRVTVDPVIKSTTGGILLREDAMETFLKKIIPLADVVTPNVWEAEQISGRKIRKKTDLLAVAKKIRKMGAGSVIITGTEFEKGRISDYIHDGKKSWFVSGKRSRLEPTVAAATLLLHSRTTWHPERAF